MSELTWCQIDPETATKAELEKEIKRLRDLANTYMNAEQAVKIFINSVYGACGSPWFSFFNMDVAEAVTLQGQDLIKYAERVIDRYFLEYWHKDVNLHKRLGLTKVEKIDRSMNIYCDTDSAFVRFDELLSKCDWKGTPKDFILKIYDEFLRDYINKCFEIYAKKNGTKNVQSFELEKILDSGVWLAKKKYVYNTVWKDPGIHIDALKEITAKGVEIVQSSSSPFARETLKNLLKYIFTKKREFNPAEFTSLLKKYKDEFKLKNLEDISHASSVGDYDKHVLMDKDTITLGKGCPIHVRGAAIYNNMLYNSKFRNKYEAIHTGEKIKYYHVKTKDESKNIFSFIPGSFPVEFAPQIDYDMQFDKSIVQPINRFVEAMGFSPLSSNLVSSAQLF